ncbi:hypothetical protein [Salinibacter ruber]|uniref:hypothetical protein n=1 Tax=Salinibacter ruber TaxID=146919 RepID=UPI00207338CD|nr:hypothetical protein [Salinibacter ruber]
MSDVLLLPSAILVPDELRADLGPIPTGMIPLHGRPTLHHIIDLYENVDPYVVCDKRADLIKKYVCRESLHWSVIELKGTTSLGDTIKSALNTILDERDFDTDENLYINFADTIVSQNQPDTNADFVSYNIEKNPIRWTCFRGDDKINSIVPKYAPTVTGEFNVFNGLFRVSKPKEFARALGDILKGERADADPFYRALQVYLTGRKYDLVRADEWIDVGHIDTYYQAKKKFLNVRKFNSLSTDGQRNRITKTTEEASTIEAEYNWYTSLPEEIEAFAPKVYRYDESSPSLELEYIGYPPLRDLHLHGAHGLHIWNRIFDRLFSMLDTFAQFRAFGDIEHSLREMYLHKTKRRLSEIQETVLRPFNRSILEINGQKVEGLPAIVGNLDSKLCAAGLLELDEFSVIHGDLCFSNILFDLRNRVVKLIDPRGKFGPYTIYGDQRYDLAKLRHSVAGNYDFVINDMFNIDVKEKHGIIKYNVYTNKEHNNRRDLFDNLIRQKFPGWLPHIKLVEALLFLSMVPIHSDSIKRQQYMLARGIKQFNEVTNP